MKKIALLSLFTISVLSASAQLNSLSENFDVKCASASVPGGGWYIFSPTSITTPGPWECTATEGRPEGSGTPTPGVMCTGIFGTPPVYNLDTSLIVSPELVFNSSVYPDSVYLNFDSKTSPVYLGGAKLTVLATLDTSLHTFTDITPSMTPVFSDEDSSGWVTHQVSLSAYVNRGPFFIGFRYTSTTTTGSVWYLDNINTTTTGLGVHDIAKDKLPLTVIGAATSSQIKLSYTAASAGICNLSIYDMVGRIMHKEQFYAKGGAATCTINGLDLNAGMYLVKLDIGASYGVVKAMVQ